MGSCSSGGPNKFTGMCLVKGGEATTEDERSKAAGHQAFLFSNADYRKGSGHAYDNKRVDTSSVKIQFDSSTKKEAAMKPLVDDRPRGSLPREDDVNAIRNRHHGGSLNETLRANFASPLATAFEDEIVGTDVAYLSPTIAYSRSLTADVEVRAPGNYCSPDDGKKAVAFRDFDDSVPTKRNVSETNLPPSSDRTAMNEIDSRNQQQRRNQNRKASAPLHRWPGEYGTCIVPAPNKTAYDAYKSAHGRLDYSPDSTWTMCWDDQKVNYNQRHPTSAATNSGCHGGEKTTGSAGLLPSGGLSSASISSSCCHGSTTSSSFSADSSSLFRRRDSDSVGAKRSSSVSSCPSSTISATAELLPNSTKSNTDDANCKNDANDQRRLTSSSENRPFASASQRFWNLLPSPMKPLNRGDVNSATKYAPLNSEVSGHDDDLTLASSSINNTVSNKNSNTDRQT